MKGVFVILDGVADEACDALGGKTPLEAAKTPNLDAIATKSRIGYCYTVKEGIAPESSSAVVSLFGYDPVYAPRGPLEAVGLGIPLKNGDLALRCNFATIDNLESGHILDSRAGRTLTTKEAMILASAINEKVKLPFPFQFVPGIQHRGVLVIRGGFSANITNADPFYGLGMASGTISPKMIYAKPMDEEDDSKLSADLINSFIRQSFEVLDSHPINKARSRKGLYVANIILCRDAGNEPPKFKKIKGKWMGLSYVPLEAGICKAMGIETYRFKYPKFRGLDVYAHLYKGLKYATRYAIKMLKRNRKNYDYFYIHFKETDVPGHDNKPLDKVKMIEMIDYRFFSFLKNFIGDSKLIITSDHVTACRRKAHTADSVPVLIYPYEKNEAKRFTEAEGLKGKRFSGRKLLENYFFSK